MSVALRTEWTIEQFLDWAGGQEGRFEFDGVRPVGMVGGSATHSRVTGNIHAALRSRLRGSSCSYFGPDLGVQTGPAVRYPDALISCVRFPEADRLASDVRVVFEVLSPATARTDRITKVRDYALVPTIGRYVLVECRFPGVTVLSRATAEAPWTTITLTEDDVLDISEAGVTIPVAEFYEDVEFPSDPAAE